jgi:hypothetical protein
VISLGLAFGYGLSMVFLIWILGFLTKLMLWVSKTTNQNLLDHPVALTWLAYVLVLIINRFFFIDL